MLQYKLQQWRWWTVVSFNSASKACSLDMFISTFQVLSLCTNQIVYSTQAHARRKTVASYNLPNSYKHPTAQEQSVTLLTSDRCRQSFIGLITINVFPVEARRNHLWNTHIQPFNGLFNGRCQKKRSPLTPEVHCMGTHSLWASERC